MCHIDEGKDLTMRVFMVSIIGVVKSWEHDEQYRNIYMVKYYATVKMMSCK